MGYNKKWGDIAELKYGKSLKGYRDNVAKYPVYGTNGKIGYTEKPLAKGPGIIIGRKGAYRGVHFSEKDFFVIDTAYYLSLTDLNIDIKWAYYELTNKDINSIDSGSAIPSTKREDFYALPVKIPPFPLQKRIAQILNTLDRKIKINEEIIQNLEELVQTLFKHWFVDFEFPNENDKPYRSSGGKMVESELGMIPENWEIRGLTDISQEPIVCGKTPSTKIKENYGIEMPFITIPDMHNKVFISETERYLSEKGIGSQPKKTIPAFSVCVSCIATPGLVVLTSEPSQTNQQINTVIPNKYDTFYVYLALKAKSDYIKELGSGGSTTLNLNKTQFSKIRQIYPTEDIRVKFHAQINHCFELMLSLQNEGRRLIDLRDTLLPKLLSGELALPTENEVTDDVPVS